MSPLLMLQVSTSEMTLDRADRLILSEVEFKNTDIREALRILFRRGLFGGTISPDVQGTVTLKLKSVPWTTVMQHVVRQVDATYRVVHGFYEVVPREVPYDPFFEEPDPREPTIRERYGEIARAVAAGKGRDVRKHIRPVFSLSKGSETLQDDAAVRRFVDSYRNYPQFVFERFVWGSIPVETVEVLVRYGRAGSVPVRYWDVWQKYPNEPWQLIGREEISPDSPMRFVNAPIAEVLGKVFRRVGVSWTLDPRLDRNVPVTLDLVELPFEAMLSRLTDMAGLNCRFEGGVYQIIPRE